MIASYRGVDFVCIEDEDKEGMYMYPVIGNPDHKPVHKYEMELKDIPAAEHEVVIVWHRLWLDWDDLKGHLKELPGFISEQTEAEITAVFNHWAFGEENGFTLPENPYNRIGTAEYKEGYVAGMLEALAPKD